MNFIKVISRSAGKKEPTYINPETISFIKDLGQEDKYDGYQYIVGVCGNSFYIDEADFRKLTQAINFTVIA